MLITRMSETGEYVLNAIKKVAESGWGRHPGLPSFNAFAGSQAA
jgi:hypothetical protein